MLSFRKNDGEGKVGAAAKNGNAASHSDIADEERTTFAMRPASRGMIHSKSGIAQHIFSDVCFPHPEERAFARVSKDEGLGRASWFEMAQAPPHHEE
jgi:hypothetical protein